MAKTLRSGPKATKPRNERFMKGSLMKIISSRQLAKSWKSGSEADKFGNQEFVFENVKVLLLQGSAGQKKLSGT